ncbi:MULTISPECIES: hypothetical protein [unclassified Enterococcus]|uniref:hypothetical protein n=1 Tax=unclassified Enterococcus TaxID=2608891 RepID=UPI001F14B396|nr:MULTISPECIES: hypothetical protein [unclassified Enterococcus]
MKKLSRKDVAATLIKDKFFSKGHIPLKIWQSLVALFGWLIVLLPFIWVFFPLTRPERAKAFDLYAFSLEKKLLFFLFLFFFVLYISFLSISFILTRWNNRRFRKIIQRTKYYNEEQLEKRC